jgi:murein L,D-transpeptidase YcbB/YkuD
MPSACRLLIPTAQWVKVAQHRLGVVADGVYGPATEAALERWHNRGRKA